MFYKNVQTHGVLIAKQKYTYFSNLVTINITSRYLIFYNFPNKENYVCSTYNVRNAYKNIAFILQYFLLPLVANDLSCFLPHSQHRHYHLLQM